MLNKIIIGMFLTIIWMFIAIPGFSQDEEKNKIAVLQFETKGDLNVTDGGQIVADWLLTAIGKTKEYTIVERERLEDILSENELSFSGIIDESTAVEIGKISGVSIIVVGTISKFVDTITVSSRMIDTETGYVISVGDIKAEDLNAIYDLVPELVDQLLITEVEEDDLLPEVEDPVEATETDETDTTESETITQETETELTLPDTVTPKSTQSEYIYPIRPIGYALIGAGVLAGGGGFLFDMFAQDSYENMNSAYDTYQNATSNFDQLWNEVEQYSTAYYQQITLRNILYISAGATVTLGVVSLFIRKPAANENFALTILPNYAALNWRF